MPHARHESTSAASSAARGERGPGLRLLGGTVPSLTLRPSFSPALTRAGPAGEGVAVLAAARRAVARVARSASRGSVEAGTADPRAARPRQRTAHRTPAFRRVGEDAETAASVARARAALRATRHSSSAAATWGGKESGTKGRGRASHRVCGACACVRNAWISFHACPLAQDGEGGKGRGEGKASTPCARCSQCPLLVMGLSGGKQVRALSRHNRRCTPPQQRLHRSPLPPLLPPLPPSSPPPSPRHATARQTGSTGPIAGTSTSSPTRAAASVAALTSRARPDNPLSRSGEGGSADGAEPKLIIPGAVVAVAVAAVRRGGDVDRLTRRRPPRRPAEVLGVPTRLELRADTPAVDVSPAAVAASGWGDSGDSGDSARAGAKRKAAAVVARAESNREAGSSNSACVVNVDGVGANAQSTRRRWNSGTRRTNHTN